MSQDDGPKGPPPPPAWRFAGFAVPTTTPVPDQLFDELMPRLAPAELVVTLYIVRRTFGFRKTSDSISLRQLTDGIVTRDGRVLDGGTGLSKATVARALNSLEEKGVILRVRNRSDQRGDEPTTYQLNFLHPVSQVETPPLSQNETPRVSSPRQAVSHQRDTQQTEGQETVRQQVGYPDRIRSSDNLGGSLSEFRRGSRPKFQEDRQGESTDPQAADASQPAHLRPANSPGLTRIGEILATKGLVTRRASRNGSSATSSDTAPTSSRSRRSRERAEATSIEPPHPSPITEEQLAEEQPQLRSQSGPPPVYIDNVMDDVASKLIKDLSEAASHRTQARNIWEASGLDVQAFVDILYEARDRVRPRRGVDNKMGYFFKTVRVLAGLDENPNPPERRPARERGGRGRTPLTEANEGQERKSLAGKYAHLVRR